MNKNKLEQYQGYRDNVVWMKDNTQYRKDLFNKGIVI